MLSWSLTLWEGTCAPCRHVDRQALVLIPTFARVHEAFPLFPALAGIVSRVKSGAVPNYTTCKPDLTTVWPDGKVPQGYSRDAFTLPMIEQEIWRDWAIRRATEMLGDADAWNGWQYPYFAP